MPSASSRTTSDAAVSITVSCECAEIAATPNTWLHSVAPTVGALGERRDTTDIEHDTLTVVEGIEGSYPNFFFVVEAAELEDFSSRIMAVRSRDDYERLVGIYGVRRTSDTFWETADWFQDYYAKQEPLLYGILDLNRYANR